VPARPVARSCAGRPRASDVRRASEHRQPLAVHDTDDPQTIVVEQEALGTSATTGEFALPNIIVLTVREGQIARLHDYVSILAAAAAIGRASFT